MKQTLLAALALTCAAPFAAAAPVITFVFSDPTPMVGQTFTVNVVATGNMNEIVGFGLTYSLGNANVSFVSAAPDAFFTDAGPLVGTDVAGVAFPGATASSVTLATFTLQAAAEGSTVFSVASDVQNPDQGLFMLNESFEPLPVFDLDAATNIDVAPIPEPSTVALALTALAAGWYVRRRART